MILVSFTLSKGQNKSDLLNDATKYEAVISFLGPITITCGIEQDRSGNIWFATFQGVFRYDGKSFTNITQEVSSANFFAVLEDRKGNLWFGSLSGIYEDTNGNIWFGANGGASRYDAKSFRNYLMNGDSITEDRTGKTIPVFQRPTNEVNTVIEDKTGKFWFGTRAMLRL